MTSAKTVLAQHLNQAMMVFKIAVLSLTESIMFQSTTILLAQTK
jgi:hypothetical protein